MPAFIVTPRARKPLGRAGTCVVCDAFTNEQFLFETQGTVVDVPACLAHTEADVLDELYWALAQNLRRLRNG